MKVYILANEFLKVTILSYGATIQSIEMPNKEGKWENIVLGFERPEDYPEKNEVFFGSIVGRTAGRTENGILKIHDKEYLLDKNAQGKHSIHGGYTNWSQKEWEGLQEGNHLRLRCSSPHLESGYPGNVRAEVCYSLLGSTLEISYSMESDEDTYCNPTNHTYFALSGKHENSIETQNLVLKAKDYVKVNKETISLEISTVDGTAFDFRRGKSLQEALKAKEDQIQIVGQGLDHPFLTNYALLKDKESGRCVEVKTDRDCIVIYTANWLHSIGRKNHSGICFETQDMPSLSKFFPEKYEAKVGKEFVTKTSFHFFLE